MANGRCSSHRLLGGTGMKFTASQAGARSARPYDVSPAVFDRNYTYLEEQMFDPSVRTKLLNLPLKVAHELRAVKTPTVRQALSMQMAATLRSAEHPSELQSLMRISYAAFCLKNNNKTQ